MSVEQERRRHPRVAVQQIVSLTSTTCTGDKAALTEDISLSGVLLKTNSCVSEGSEVTFVLAMPAQISQAGEVRILCRGKVLRRTEKGDRAAVAVEFSNHALLPKRNDKAA